MSKILFLTATEPRSGKSAIALGLMEMLKRKIAHVGFFRPIIDADPACGPKDHDIELIADTYMLDSPYEQKYGLTLGEAMRLAAADREPEILEIILRKFHQLAEGYDFVLCEGTDFEGTSAAFEADLNAEIARNLGSPVLLVAKAHGRSIEETVRAAEIALDSLHDKGCQVIATIANRVDPKDRAELLGRLGELEVTKGQLLFAVSEDKTLGSPTVGEIAQLLGAEVLWGETQLNRHVYGFTVAAMHLTHFLEWIKQGFLVITPGDRADVIVACLAATSSSSMHNVAGLVLTGGLRPEPVVWELVKGFRRQIPILSVAEPTYETARLVSDAKSTISCMDPRKIQRAISVFEKCVDVDALEREVVKTETTAVTPKMFEYALIRRAQKAQMRIVMPEAADDRILRAAEILARRKVAKIILLGQPERTRARGARLGLHLEEVDIIDPQTSELAETFAERFLELRKHKGITLENARDAISDVSYFGTMMVKEDHADGMVSGAAHTTAATIRPAFEIIKTRPGAKVVSSVFFMCLSDRVLVYGDCAINPNPNAEQLAEIAISSARTARTFGVTPRVALLSYSSGESGKGTEVEKVRRATELAREQAARDWPDLLIEGPIQYDAAIDPGVAATKMPDSAVAGRATVLVFPDLNTGNNTYKAVQRSAGAVAVGPVLQGLNQPVNDLSRGCTVTDIVNTVAITAVQAADLKEP
ncbi:MAG: phosphate acetyltransferase [bacterium]